MLAALAEFPLGDDGRVRFPALHVEAEVRVQPRVTVSHRALAHDHPAHPTEITDLNQDAAEPV